MSQYLDLAYAVVVDERVRRGMTLWDAIDDVRDFAAGGSAGEAATARGIDASSNTAKPQPNVEAMNNNSLAALEAMMSGVSGGFR